MISEFEVDLRVRDRASSAAERRGPDRAPGYDWYSTIWLRCPLLPFFFSALVEGLQVREHQRAGLHADHLADDRHADLMLEPFFVA